MITRLKINHQQAGEAVKNADLPGEITGASQAVAVILTQSWCPQWAFMNMSLQGLNNGLEDMDLTIFTYEYDLSPIFQEFMNFKETKFRNWEVPYVRLYWNGKFIGDGNSMPAGRMLQQFRSAAAPEGQFR
jgi:hypothetical protein